VSKFDTAAIYKVRDSLEAGFGSARSLEDAAQRLCRGVYDAFSSTVVMARVYVVARHADLPPSVSDVADALATSKGLNRLSPETPVMTLTGTRGALPAWNDRHTSAGHQAIPLASSAFVSQIPMVAALLSEMGLGLGWIDQRDLGFVEKHMGNLMGLFFVPDAASQLDSQGRKIIPAQDFVKQHGVRSVFGLGSSLGSGLFMALIVFTNTTLHKEDGERFTPLLSCLKRAAASLVQQKKIFSGP